MSSNFDRRLLGWPLWLLLETTLAIAIVLAATAFVFWNVRALGVKFTSFDMLPSYAVWLLILTRAQVIAGSLLLPWLPKAKP